MAKHKEKIGRPRADLDFDQLKAFMRMNPTRADSAAFFSTSEDTIERRIKKETGLAFAAFREQNMVHTRMHLIRTALKRADNGSDTMLIFCLKNLCGWRDKQPDEDTQQININLTLADRMAKARTRAKGK